MAVKLVAAVWLASMASCLDKNAVYWAPYNGDDDVINIDVGVAEEDDRAAELHSNTGATTVGDATISPGAGPVGTEHTVTVLLDEEFGEDVGRVSVEAESVRGVTIHELVQDSAQPGTWVVRVTSLGETDEVREDSFRFVLWQESDKDDPDAVKAE